MRNKPASHQQHAKKSAARNKRIELEGGVRKNRLVAEPAQSLAALGPDLIPLARVFPVQPGLDVAKVNGELEAAFNDLASLRERNPFGNSVKLLALEINKRLDKGSLTYGGVETLIQELTVQAYEHRADRLGNYLGERDDARNAALLRQAIRHLAVRDGEVAGKRKAPPRPFAEFKSLVERELFGIVMTAHPTFSQSTGMMRVMAELALGKDVNGKSLSAAERKRRIGIARAVEHRAPERIDLAYEHDLSIEAIRNAAAAARGEMI